MLESLKSLWAKWKIQVSMVGGVIVLATAYGTCSYDPQAVSEVDTTPVIEVTTTTPTVPVSGTTTTEPTEINTSTGTETTTETTTTGE